MTVYVDDMMARVKGSGIWELKLSHMFSDDPTLQELHAMADIIGLNRTWFQSAKDGHRLPHYDVCEAKIRKAIANGAVSLRVGTKEWLSAVKASKAANQRGSDARAKKRSARKNPKKHAQCRRENTEGEGHPDEPTKGEDSQRGC